LRRGNPRIVLDLRILNGTVTSDGISGPLDVGIERGTIVEVAAHGAIAPARRELDATGLHVLPGAVDAHFHCRAPSSPPQADFASETRAAAAGGVTTILEMPIANPACSTPEVFRIRRELAEREAHVNVALFAGAAVTPERASEMAKLGAIAFKLFTTTPPPGREPQFDGLWATDSGKMLDALSAVAGVGRICVVHAENDPLIGYFSALKREQDGISARPPVIEAVAIGMIGTLSIEAGTRVHIAHLTSREALAALKAIQAMGAVATGETCPQYLVLDSSAVDRHGGVAKIAPPLRHPADQDALWKGLADGTIDLVASDHAPFPVEQKVGVDFDSAPLGLPTVELLLPVVLDGAARGKLPLPLAVDLVSSRPARLFGLAGRKGTISVGADADIVLANLNETSRPGPDTLLSRGRGCGIAYDGLELRARVETTIVDGAVVYADGAIVGEKQGGFVRPQDP
jgi:dihydroorotase (multifunctional complex type)